MNLSRPIPQAKPPAPEAVSATALLRGKSVLVIEHGGERYVLRLTRSGKLVLTK